MSAPIEPGHKWTPVEADRARRGHGMSDLTPECLDEWREDSLSVIRDGFGLEPEDVGDIADTRILALIDALESARAERDAYREAVEQSTRELRECTLAHVVAKLTPCSCSAQRDRAVRAEAKVARVEKIHEPIKVYDECEHGDECPFDPFPVYDYTACANSFEGWACRVCCYHDEYPLEDCPHSANHRNVPREKSCPTHAALGDGDA